MVKNRCFAPPFFFSLAVLLLLSLSACSSQMSSDPGMFSSEPSLSGSQAEQPQYPVNLMDHISPISVSGREWNEPFSLAAADFSIRLFQETVRAKENTLVSPLSVMISLSMAANGADGQTRAEMASVLGGSVALEDLNEYFYAFHNRLVSDDIQSLHLANSIWFRDNANRFLVYPEFLQKNLSYYQAEAYQSAFDENTLQDINAWASAHTNGMIDQILSEIDPLDVMYLINAIAFEAKWETPYSQENISNGEFTAADAAAHTVSMMSSTEHWYIEDDKASGFIKDYSDGAYRFVALLPEEGVNITDYIASLTGESMLRMLQEAKRTSVFTQMPKFSSDDFLSMKAPLEKLGMSSAFDSNRADFSKLGESSLGNIFIGDVVQRTFLCVDELGTTAGAASAVIIAEKSSLPPKFQVVLNRPFVYFILDGETSIPLFMGTVMDFS